MIRAQVRALHTSADVCVLYAAAVKELEARVSLTMKAACQLRAMYSLRLGVPMTSSRWARGDGAAQLSDLPLCRRVLGPSRLPRVFAAPEEDEDSESVLERKEEDSGVAMDTDQQQQEGPVETKTAPGVTSPAAAAGSRRKIPPQAPPTATSKRDPAASLVVSLAGFKMILDSELETLRTRWGGVPVGYGRDGSFPSAMTSRGRSTPRMTKNCSVSAGCQLQRVRWSPAKCARIGSIWDAST